MKRSIHFWKTRPSHTQSKEFRDYLEKKRQKRKQDNEQSSK